MFDSNIHNLDSELAQSNPHRVIDFRIPPILQLCRDSLPCIVMLVDITLCIICPMLARKRHSSRHQQGRQFLRMERYGFYLGSLYHFCFYSGVFEGCCFSSRIVSLCSYRLPINRTDFYHQQGDLCMKALTAYCLRWSIGPQSMTLYLTRSATANQRLIGMLIVTLVTISINNRLSIIFFFFVFAPICKNDQILS